MTAGGFAGCASASAFFGFQSPADTSQDSLAVEEQTEFIATGLAIGVEEGAHVDGEDLEGSPSGLRAAPGVELSIELPAHQARWSQCLENLWLGAEPDHETIGIRYADSNLGVGEAASREQRKREKETDALHWISPCTPSPINAAPL